MMLGIIGSGNVGGALGRAFVSKGVDVLFYDVRKEPLLILENDGYNTTTKWDDIVNADIVAIAVPTESLPNGDCNTMILREVIEHLAKDWAHTTKKKTVIQVSTCPPKTGRWMRSLLPEHVDYVVIPSFYNMSRMLYDALHPSKVLIGTETGKTNILINDLYNRFGGPLFTAPYETVELAKYAHNCLSAALISFWNEIWLVAEKLSVNSDWIARCVDQDAMFRSVYRFHSKAWGGPCLPKDTQAFVNWCRKEAQVEPRIMAATIAINQNLRDLRGENVKHLYQAGAES